MLRDFELSDDLVVCQSPSMPGLVPSWVELRGQRVVLQNTGRIVLPSKRDPLMLQVYLPKTDRRG